jgi:glycosyltransferase involved in cell wall biosynthesis
MRILYVATRICWPIRSGAHLRDFHIAHHLARNARLTYIGMDSGENGTQTQEVSRDPIEPFGDAEVIRVRRSSGYSVSKIVRGLTGPLPLVVLNYTSPLVTREIERVLSSDSFDVVQIEGVFLSAYAQRIRELAPRALLNSDMHNVESEVLARFADKEPNFARRLYAHRTATLLRRQEDHLLRHCDSHTVCSEVERQFLLSRNLNPRVAVIPNGVDVASFSHSSDDTPRRSLIFVGSMDYHANVDGVLFFAKEVWPAIHRQRPDLQFIVVGSKPVSEVLKLCEQPGITVTGTVDDVRPYYYRALAAMVPLRIGGGTRLKILEAMAAGTPVISTSMGAEGIPVTHGRDILLADSPQEMIEATTSLQENSELWNGLIAAGRTLATSYDWSAIGDKLLRFYDAQLAEPAVKAGR